MRTQTHGEARQDGRSRVLVIDDDREMAALLERALDHEGFAVTVETRGERAITTACSADFDAIVVDKEMPGLNGLDFVSYVRHRSPGTPVVLLTAFGGDLVAHEARRRGASAYLEKPVRLARLVETIRIVLADGEPAGPPHLVGSTTGAVPATGPPARLPPRASGTDAAAPWAVVLPMGYGERPRHAALLDAPAMLGRTLDRVALAVSGARTVIAGVRHFRTDLERDVGTRPVRLLLQPEDRGTGTSVLFAVHWILARDPDALVALLPSAPVVGLERPLIAHMLALTDHVARHPERIALVGAVPAAPDREYGCWVTPGPMLARTPGGPLWAVEGFVPTPSAERARRLWATGSLWNTSVVVAKATTLVNAAWQLRRALADEIASAVGAGTGAQDGRALARIYAGLSPVNFSTDILEQCLSILAVSRLDGLTGCEARSPSCSDRLAGTQRV